MRKKRTKRAPRDPFVVTVSTHELHELLRDPKRLRENARRVREWCAIDPYDDANIAQRPPKDK